MIDDYTDALKLMDIRLSVPALKMLEWIEEHGDRPFSPVDYTETIKCDRSVVYYCFRRMKMLGLMEEVPIPAIPEDLGVFARRAWRKSHGIYNNRKLYRFRPDLIVGVIDNRIRELEQVKRRFES